MPSIKVISRPEAARARLGLRLSRRTGDIIVMFDADDRRTLPRSQYVQALSGADFGGQQVPRQRGQRGPHPLPRNRRKFLNVLTNPLKTNYTDLCYGHNALDRHPAAHDRPIKVSNASG